MMQDFDYIIILLSILLLGSQCSSRTVYLEHQCGRIISLAQEPKGTLKLSLTPNDAYAPYSNCHVTVVANQNTQIGVTFLLMDIMSFRTCQSDYLQLYDGVTVNNSTFLYAMTHDHEQHCGRRLPPYYASQHSNITVRFVSDGSFSSKGFKLLFTAFHTGSCRSDEYKCGNDRCIHEDLRCDKYDNCGDRSDVCQFSLLIIVGVAVSSVILVIALVFLCSVLHYRFRKRVTPDDSDSISIGTEFTGFDQELPLPSESNPTSTPAWMSGLGTNVISIITRGSLDSSSCSTDSSPASNHHFTTRDRQPPEYYAPNHFTNRHRQPPEYCPATPTSLWLNNQPVF